VNEIMLGKSVDKSLNGDMNEITLGEITLDKSVDKSLRIQVLTMLYEKAEGKVFHADTFRQRNMNYALVIFAGLIAAELRLGDQVPHYILSATLTILMVIFAIWDRRWHKNKHGWDATSKACYDKLAKLANNSDRDVKFATYEKKGEETAEWGSWQPIVFYFLVVASVASFWVLGK
jgi:hypothetical protein